MAGLSLCTATELSFNMVGFISALLNNVMDWWVMPSLFLPLPSYWLNWKVLEVSQTYNLNTHLRKEPTLLVVSSRNDIQQMNAEISTAGVSLRRSGECILLPEANFPRPFNQIVTCHIGGISAFWYHFCGETWHSEMSAVFSTLSQGGG